MTEPRFPRQRTSARRASRCLGVIALAATTALPAAADPAAGEALFREGRRLFEEGKIAEACAKFADSQALDASSGTLLNLADCHETQGKTATAWAEFLAAAQLAQLQHKPQHEEEATRRANALESKLSFLTIEVAEPRAGLEVRKDGQLIPKGVLGTRIPVDPGEHLVEASAPGYQGIRLTVAVGPSGDFARALIPALAPQQSEAQRGSAPVRPVDAVQGDAAGEGSSRSALPWVIGGTGIAALGVGAVFGIMALSADRDADQACPERVGCSDEAMDAAARRDRQAWIANAGIGVGLAGIGVAALMLLLRDDAPVPESGRAPKSALRADASVEPGALSIRVVGAF